MRTWCQCVDTDTCKAESLFKNPVDIQACTVETGLASFEPFRGIKYRGMSFVKYVVPGQSRPPPPPQARNIAGNLSANRNRTSHYFLLPYTQDKMICYISCLQEIMHTSCKCTYMCLPWCERDVVYAIAAVVPVFALFCFVFVVIVVLTPFLWG